MHKFEKIKLKYVSDIFNGNSIPDERKDEYSGKPIPYIPTKELSAFDGTINYDNGLSVDESDGFRIAPANSVLMCIEGGSAGKKIGLTDRQVAFVNKLCCFCGKEIDSNLLYQCLQSKDFLDQFYLNMTGMIGGVSVSALRNMYISFPVDVCYQNTLASYIKKKIDKVNALISNQEKQIEKLKTYKRALITEGVTKGLNHEKEMKDSGIEWIGVIPRTWKIQRKLSYAVSEGISYGIVKLLEPDDVNGIKVIRCSDVLEGNICEDNIRTVTKAVSDEYSRTVLKGGEVLVNVRGTLGGCAVVPPEMKGYNIAREVAKVSLNGTIYNKYLMYYLMSDAFIDYRTRYLSGSVYVGLNIELLSSCPLPMPLYDEQIAICNYLDNKCIKIDQLIEIKQRKIASLSDYKKSLIYEYVTGKKEVPSA